MLIGLSVPWASHLLLTSNLQTTHRSNHPTTQLSCLHPSIPPQANLMSDYGSVGDPASELHGLLTTGAVGGALQQYLTATLGALGVGCWHWGAGCGCWQAGAGQPAGCGLPCVPPVVPSN